MLCLLAGSFVTILVTLASVGWVDARTANPVTAQQVSGDEHWEVWRWDRPTATAILSVRRCGLSWSPRQATGPPDTPGAGDQVTAWAAAQSSSAAGDWLELDYPKAVVPRSVRVYETYHPGAIVRVTAFRPDRITGTADGTEVEAWRGTDPTPPSSASGVSDIPLSVPFPTSRVRLYVDSVKVPGWNEIDAVQLVGQGGELQWARDAWASSFYGSGNVAPGASVSTPAPADLLPGWAGLDRPGAAVAVGPARQEARVIDARGWPMPALYSRRELGAAPASAAMTSTALPLLSLGGSTYTTATRGSITTFGATGFSSTGLPSNLPPPPMPLRPVWPGFAVDALCFAVALALLRWVLSAPGRFVREVSRMRQGRCIACGYDLGYDFLRGCPECGWRRSAGAAAAVPSREGVGTPGQAAHGGASGNGYGSPGA